MYNNSNTNEEALSSPPVPHPPSVDTLDIFHGIESSTIPIILALFDERKQSGGSSVVKFVNARKRFIRKSGAPPIGNGSSLLPEPYIDSSDAASDPSIDNASTSTSIPASLSSNSSPLSSLFAASP